jgi:hypothetical protein
MVSTDCTLHHHKHRIGSKPEVLFSQTNQTIKMWNNMLVYPKVYRPRDTMLRKSTRNMLLLHFFKDINTPLDYIV